MKKRSEVQNVLCALSRNLGKKLTTRMGKVRLRDIAAEIAFYQEQTEWSNTPQEIGRLRDKLHYIPALVGLQLGALRLSKQSQKDVNAALWATLHEAFPSIRFTP